jgi:hypothetical protein
MKLLFQVKTFMPVSCYDGDKASLSRLIRIKVTIFIAFVDIATKKSDNISNNACIWPVANRAGQLNEDAKAGCTDYGNF